MSIKIGDTVYYKEERGVLYNVGVVLGETSRSWLTLPLGYSGWHKELERFAKRLPKNLKGYIVGTKRDADLARWVLDHRHRVGTALHGQDAELILKVAKMIGYTNLPEGETL